MAEFWQDVASRADASNGIWQTFAPAFKVGEVTLAAHQADTALLPTRNQEKATQEGVTDAARDARAATLALIHDLAVRVPRAFEATLPADDTLLDDIVLLRNTFLDSDANIQARGQDVLTLWVNGNARRAAQVPAQGALVVGGKVLAALQAALVAVQPLEAALSTERGALSKVRSALRALTARVDRNNKRWYLAWLAEFPPGTPENDALSLIDTGSPASGGSGSPGGGSGGGPVVPAVPGNLTLTPGPAGSGLLTVEWDAVAGAVAYRLRAGSGTEQTLVGEFSAPPAVLSLPSGVEQVLTVSAFNAAGESAQSAPVTGAAG